MRHDHKHHVIPFLADTNSASWSCHFALDLCRALLSLSLIKSLKPDPTLLCKTSHNNMPALQIWENPATEKPVLEPCFVAAFHGIELCFLLLAEFISDDRKYVFRRPRVELVANDIQKQCLLLTEVRNAVVCCCQMSHVRSHDKPVAYAAAIQFS